MLLSVEVKQKGVCYVWMLSPGVKTNFKFDDLSVLLQIKFQVQRRGSYKGNVAQPDKDTLPMDCCSVPGVFMILAQFLTAKGLTSTQLEQCMAIVVKLEMHVDITETLTLIPNLADGQVAVVNNQISTKNLKGLLRQLGIPFKKLLACQLIRRSSIGKQIQIIVEFN